MRAPAVNLREDGAGVLCSRPRRENSDITMTSISLRWLSSRSGRGGFELGAADVVVHVDVDVVESSPWRRYRRGALDLARDGLVIFVLVVVVRGFTGEDRGAGLSCGSFLGFKMTQDIKT